MAGASLPMVMKFMGHSQWSTTLGYAHLAPNALDPLAALLDKSSDKVLNNGESNSIKLVEGR